MLRNWDRNALLVMAAGGAGLAVGLVDGVAAARAAGLGGGALVRAVALVASVDALVGVVLAVVAWGLATAARWGWAGGRAPARLLGWVVLGVGVGATVAALLAATAMRRNRFLVAAIAATVAAIGGALATWLGPAPGRLILGPRRGVRAGRSTEGSPRDDGAPAAGAVRSAAESARGDGTRVAAVGAVQSDDGAPAAGVGAVRSAGGRPSTSSWGRPCWRWRRWRRWSPSSCGRRPGRCDVDRR